MKIAYIGIDLLDAALKTLLTIPGCEIMEIFTCNTDNRVEFNTEVIAIAEQNHIPWTDTRITRDDMLRLIDGGCQAIICGAYYYKVPVMLELPCVNIHPSALPIGRGSWPMPQAILRNLDKSAVTFHCMAPTWDSGYIIMHKFFPIDNNENLKTFMSKVSRCIEEMIPVLMADFDNLYASAVPQVGGEYWDAPTEDDWTVTPDMDDSTIDLIFRAFYGYECIWLENGCKYELIGAQLVESSDRALFRTKSGAYVIADACRQLPVEIDLTMAQQVETLRKASCCDSAAYAFASLFIWKKELELSILLTPDFYAVKCDARGKNTWYFPCGDEKAVHDFIASHIDEPNFRLVNLTDKQTELFSRWFPNTLNIVRDEASDEYICDARAHLTLEGSSYRNVRNHWHKAMREHTLRLENVTGGNISAAYNILSSWTAAQFAAIADGKPERRIYENAEKTLLDHHIELGAEVYILHVDGEPFAVLSGYALSNDTFDLSLAKEKAHLPGVAYAAKHLLFEQLAERYRYINLEDDLGHEGLRRMKKALVPVKMINISKSILEQ